MVKRAFVGALAIDAAIGWPARLYRIAGHPVGGFAAIIIAGERRLNRSGWPAPVRRAAGLATLLAVGGTGWGAARFAETMLARLLGGRSRLAAALVAWPALAQRSLDDHVRAVADALDRRDLPAARTAVARIVGRDADALDTAGIARAVIESLAESFCDGVVAPAVWLRVAGPAGAWAYKAVNTADSLVGHREPRWAAFGWASARADDLLNLAPARLAGALLCVAGGGGWATMRRDARHHASPNAGWPEAAMAGALGLRLGGPVAYDGRVAARPWIGLGRAPHAGDVRRALRVYRRACLLLWLLGGMSWGR